MLNRVYILLASLSVAVGAILLDTTFVCADPVPTPKYYIGIAPAVDKWITLPMGAVYQGVEISFLLGQQLANSGKFIPVLTNPPPLATPIPLPTPSTFSPTGPHTLMQRAPADSLSSSQAALEDRLSQIPTEWTQWLNTSVPLSENQNTTTHQSVVSNIMVQQTPTDPTVGQGLYNLRITPVVDTLIFSSGARSDRQVYGFSPDHINPFNMGHNGGLDNTYTASLTQIQQCQKADFFNGQLNPNGYGPFSSNYGSNFDEGVTFNLFGQGVAFILKQFQVVDQIRFLIDDLQTGAHEERIYNTQAKGTDVFVWGSYKNISGSIDIQTRTTMIAALQKLLPQVVNDFITQRFPNPWMSSIISVNPLTLGAGISENVQQGLQVASPNGDIFQVVSVNIDGVTANLEQIAGNYAPQVGDLVQAYVGQPLVWPQAPSAPAPLTVQSDPGAGQVSNAKVMRIAASTSNSQGSNNNVQTFVSQKTIQMDQTVRAAQQVAAVAACVDKKPGMIEQALDSLFIPYGYYRYAEVYDQTAKPPKTAIQTVGALRVAIIDSGIDVKDSKIQSHLAFGADGTYQGFDFISWDNRPSDDNGHGTAAAKLLLSLVKKPILLLSAKVIGSQGEISSSTVYDGFNFAIQSKVDAIVVPWSSMSTSLDAYIMGAQMAAASNIPVFVAPGTVPAQTNIIVGSSGAKKFKTSGLEATVVLPPEGVSAVQALANWINSK